MGADCYCPDGPASFTEKQHPEGTEEQHPAGDWDRSRDHFPDLKKDHGTKTRLMHVHCNRVDYSNLALEARLLSLTDDQTRPLDQRAVDVAMEEHLRQLKENSGRLPKGRKAWKAATRTARDTNDLIRTLSGTYSTETPLLDRWRPRSANALREAAIASRQESPGRSVGPSPRDMWERYVEWEKSIPNRFDPDLAAELSDYNVHHLLYDATPEEIQRLFDGEDLERSNTLDGDS
jgi:hypothetical protein